MVSPKWWFGVRHGKRKITLFSSWICSFQASDVQREGSSWGGLVGRGVEAGLELMGGVWGDKWVSKVEKSNIVYLSCCLWGLNT